MQNRYGSGCINIISSLPVHNPQPSSDRGKLRHNARSDNDKKRAESIWKKDRSKFPRCRPKKKLVKDN
jgi:hypothetical protein